MLISSEGLFGSSFTMYNIPASWFLQAGLYRCKTTALSKMLCHVTRPNIQRPAAAAPRVRGASIFLRGGGPRCCLTMWSQTERSNRVGCCNDWGGAPVLSTGFLLLLSLSLYVPHWAKTLHTYNQKPLRTVVSAQLSSPHWRWTTWEMPKSQTKASWSQAAVKLLTPLKWGCLILSHILGGTNAWSP